MIKAYVLIRIEANKVDRVLTELTEIKEIKTACVVTGPFDLIAFVEVKDFQELGNLISGKVHKLDGILSTTTCIAIKGRC